MSKRRAPGEGMIRQRPTGLWEARLTLPDGTRRAVYAKTRTEVARKLATAKRDAEQGIGPVDERVTVAAFLAQWLEASKPHVRPRTWETNESMVRVHLVPTLGRTKLARLSAAQVDRMLASALADGLSPATVNRIRAVLRIALGQAVRWDLVPRNVVTLTNPVKAEPHTAQPLNAEQAAAFLAATVDSRLHALWCLALGTGLRQGEALALQWGDVDLDAGTAAVRYTLQPKRGGAASWKLAPPKSKRARRTVSLPAFVVTALRAHRAAQGREKLAAGGAWAEGDFVFTTAVGTPCDGPTVTKRLQRALDDARLPHQRFHDLRHAAASLLLAQGADLRTVMEVLGHSSITLTANTYSHVGKAAMKDAADKMDAALAGGA